METDRVPLIEAKVDKLAEQLRNQPSHIAELHRCVARLQTQVAAVERAGMNQRRPEGVNDEN
jgi:predicted transcriptional regulator